MDTLATVKDHNILPDYYQNKLESSQKSLLQIFEIFLRCETGSEFKNSGFRMVKRLPKLAALKNWTFWRGLKLSTKIIRQYYHRAKN